MASDARSSEGITVLLVEDLEDVSFWLSQLVREAIPGATVKIAHDLASATRLLDQTPAIRIALVDLRLPDGSGIDLIRRIEQNHPGIEAIVTTIYGDDDHVFPALKAGARGYLLKDQPQDALRWHLANLPSGVPALSPSVARRVMEHFRQHALAPTAGGKAAAPLAEDVSLTPRESEVLALIGRGLRANEAARQLGLAESTIVTYVKNIYRKLSISSRAEAAIEARRRGLT